MAHRRGLGLALAAVAASWLAAGGVAADWRGDPTPLDLRRQAALEALDARLTIDHYDDPAYPTPNLVLDYDWKDGYQDKASAVFGLVDMGVAPMSRLDEANRALRYEMARWPLSSEAQVDDGAPVWMHRQRTLGVRLYFLYSHWMDDDIVAEYGKRFGWMVREAWRRKSENIKMTNNSAFFLAHEAMGATGDATYEDVRGWLVAELRSLLRRGFHEWGGSYQAWTLIATLNLAEFSSDDEVRELARMVVDQHLLMQLTQSIDGIFNAARVRSYMHGTLNAAVAPMTRASRMLFGGHPADEGIWPSFVLSNYRPMWVHQTLYEDDRPFTGRGHHGDVRSWYHYWTRGEGFLLSAHQSPMPDWYVLPSGGTHDVQQALIQSAAADRNVVLPYPYTPTNTAKKKRNLTQRSFAWDNVVIVQNSGTTRPVWAGDSLETGVPARLYRDVAFSRQLDGGWAFLTDGTAYVAWAPGMGDPMDDPDGPSFNFHREPRGQWLRSSHVPGDDGEPIVIEVGDAASFGSFAEFKSAVKARNARPRWDGTQLRYTTRDGTRLTWRSDDVLVDGAPFDPTGWPRWETPWSTDGARWSVGGDSLTFDPEAASTSGTTGRVPGNMVFGDAEIAPAGSPALGYVWGQSGDFINGWAYDHESEQTLVEVLVLESPEHSEPTALGTFPVDLEAPEEQDANIRELIQRRLGVEAPPGHPLVWAADFDELLPRLGATAEGTYRIQLRALDQQDVEGGSRLLATFPEGVDTFEVVLGEGTGTPPGSDGGMPAADAGGDHGGDTAGAATGGCGCAAPGARPPGQPWAALALVVVGALVSGRSRRRTASRRGRTAGGSRGSAGRGCRRPCTRSGCGRARGAGSS